MKCGLIMTAIMFGLSYVEASSLEPSVETEQPRSEAPLVLPKERFEAILATLGIDVTQVSADAQLTRDGVAVLISGKSYISSDQLYAAFPAPTTSTRSRMWRGMQSIVEQPRRGEFKWEIKYTICVDLYFNFIEKRELILALKEMRQEEASKKWVMQ